MANFKGQVWSANGPELMQRVTTRICSTKDSKKHTRQQCSGVMEVHERMKFHPVEAEHYRRFFRANYTNIVLKTINDSIGVHTWNSHRFYQVLPNEPNSVYSVLARKNCPKTFITAPDF